MNAEAAGIVRELALEPHPEGGFYREVFRSPHSVTDVRGSTRSALTVIYFLLPGDAVSKWHRIQSDETWHFVRGAPLEVVMLGVAGNVERYALGPDGPAVAAIAAGHPFAARVRPGGAYALVTCCVAPGFEFEDFELLDPRHLLAAYRAAADVIADFSA